VHALKCISGVHVQLHPILSRDTTWRLVVKSSPLHFDLEAGWASEPICSIGEENKYFPAVNGKLHHAASRLLSVPK
jgi:hypothetical protein